MAQRDGSLIRRKQEQWARERADEQNSAWFPFGRPGGGSPNRAFSSRNPEGSSAEVHHPSSYSSSSHTHRHEDDVRNEVPPPVPPKPQFVQQEFHPPVPGPRRPSDASDFPPSHPLFCANPMLPYQVPPYGPPTWLPQGMSGMPYVYNMLPPGTIPIPVQVVNESIQNGEPICPVTMLQNMQNMVQMSAQVPGMMMAPPGSHLQMPTVASKLETQMTSVNEIASSVASISLNSDSRPSTGKSSEAPIPRPRVSREEEYERVVAEKREQRREEEERERVEREWREQRQREEEERRATEEREEELRKSRDRAHNAVLEALEKAQKEAEVMKKARLYKHVIEGSEEKPELEKKLLGVDTETGEEILKLVSQFERQRKYENDALPKKKSTKPAVDQNANHLPQPRSRASSIGGESDPPPPPALSRSSLGRSSLRTPTTRKNSSAGKENIKWNSNENIANASSPLKMGIIGGGAGRPQTAETTVIRRTTKVFDSGAPPPSLNKQTSPLSSLNRFVDAAPPPRPSTLRSVNDFSNPLFSPISTRSRKMRPTAESPVVASSVGGGKTEGTSSGSTSPIQSPVPQIRIDLDTKTPLIAAEEILSKMRSRSVVSSPTYASPGRASPLASSIYARKIAEKGCNAHDEDRLSPDIRRKAESNLSRQSSMASLNGSLYNLRGSVSNLSAVGAEDSPNLGRYRVMNPAYRSFNVKKTSDRQKETLDRLTRLREQLRAKENFMDRPLSRHGSNLSVRQ